MTRAASFVMTALVATVAPAVAQQTRQATPETTGRPTVTAVRLNKDEHILLDGRLDEPIWARTVPATDFVQQVPSNGSPATERTEVRFVFTRDALYLGVNCFDSEPDKLLGPTLKRDDFLRSDDVFKWVFDPFLTAQGGYFFEMNPSGQMSDSLMSATSQSNREWDGIWDARARKSEMGWTLEIEIPFSTLNFPADAVAWGVNFQRTVKRKNEDSVWVGWGFNQGLNRIQNTGLLQGLTDVSQGLGLDIRPYGVATATASPGRGQTETTQKSNAGVDIYYSLTPALRANLTVNTDFAQTEVDQRLVNLTQFPVFFAEKRNFFLEGTSFFDFVSTSQRIGGGNDTSIVPFFSRRIGLTDQGTPQKVEFGTKLTGQVGRQDIGVLQMRTANDGRALGEDFTVLRVKRRMLRQSYVGMLYTRRAVRDGDIDPRNTVGLDYRLGTASFRGSQNLESTGYFVQATPDALVTGRNRAYGLAVDYPNDRYAAGFGYREVQESYNPAVGFTQRNAYRRYKSYVHFQPRPRSSRRVRQYVTGLDSEIQLSTLDNDYLLRQWDATLVQVNFQSQDQFNIHVVPTYARLDRPFTVSRGITLPVGGEYDYSRLRFVVGTATRRRLSVTATSEFGSFYSGDRTLLSFDGGIRARTGVVLALYGEWNWVDLPQGRFTTQLYRAILDTQFNPWISITNNIQYDSVSAQLGWQSRFRWILAPGDDLYFVYNHNWLNDRLLDRFTTLDRQAASKILYTKRF